MPLHIVGLVDDQRDQSYHYWLFASIDLYNWRTQYSPFSDNSGDLINLLEIVFFTQQSTCDDCQQLLQVLFTTEEREIIWTEARKLVLVSTREPPNNQTDIDAVFPLTHPEWDINMTEGKGGSWFTIRLSWQVSKSLQEGPLTWLRCMTLVKEIMRAMHLS